MWYVTIVTLTNYPRQGVFGARGYQLLDNLSLYTERAISKNNKEGYLFTTEGFYIFPFQALGAQAVKQTGIQLKTSVIFSTDFLLFVMVVWNFQ